VRFLNPTRFIELGLASAAARLGITAIGIEMSEEYCEIAARRIDHALDQRANRTSQPRLVAD